MSSLSLVCFYGFKNLVQSEVTSIEHSSYLLDNFVLAGVFQLMLQFQMLQSIM